MEKMEDGNWKVTPLRNMFLSGKPVSVRIELDGEAFVSSGYLTDINDTINPDAKTREVSLSVRLTGVPTITS